MTGNKNNPEFRVIQGENLEPYSPPRHTGTQNLRLLDGQISGGKVSVVHGEIQPDGEAQPHFHKVSSQFTHILSGECILRLDDQEHQLKPGDSCFIPTDVTHQVVVTSTEPLKLINVYQPALLPEDILEP